MEVVKAFRVGLCSCGVAELHIREFLRSFDHVVLMSEGIREDRLAAGIRQLARRVIALLAFRDVLLDDILHAELLARLCGAVDEVQVVGGILIVKGDESDLEILCGIIRGNCGNRSADKACCHSQTYQYA